MPRGFIKNPRFEKLLDTEEQIVSQKLAAAKRAAAAARGATPHGTGRTARSFVVVQQGNDIAVGNTDPFFHLTEFGSVNNPPYAPLRRGIRAAGLRLEETGP